MLKVCNSGSGSAKRRLYNATQLSWRTCISFISRAASHHASSSTSLSSSSAQYSSPDHKSFNAIPHHEKRNESRERQYHEAASQKSFINNFLKESYESNYQLSSSSLLRFATKLRTHRDMVQPQDVAKILNQIRNPGYKYGKFHLRSSEGTTQLLQEVNNIIYKYFLHGNTSCSQQRYSQVFHIIHALRNVCATHPEIRNIMGTLTKIIKGIDGNRSSHPTDADHISNSDIKLAFGGLMHKHGHFDHVQELCDSLLQHLKCHQSITFQFYEISHILRGLNQFDAAHDNTRELLRLLVERMEPKKNGIDYHPKFVRRALQGMAQMKCDSEEVCSMLDLVTIEFESLNKIFLDYDVEKTFYSLRNKRSETPSVRYLLQAIYHRRKLMLSGNSPTFDKFGSIVYGFRNMSAEENEVKQIMLWICLNLQEAILHRREDEHITPVVLGKMFYGIQRMSNVNDEEIDMILDTFMDCIHCLKLDKDGFTEEITDHHLISQIFFGLRNFKIKREDHVQILRYLLGALQQKSTKRNLECRLSPYQSLAILQYGGKSLDETSPLIKSLTNDHGWKDDVEKVSQKLLESIFDECVHHDYRNAKLQRTMQSKTEAKVFKIVKEEVHAHNSKATKSKDVVVGFNEILFGFEADIVLYMNNKDTDTVSKIINIEVDGSYHLEYHTKRFCDARDRVLRNKYDNEVIRLNLVEMSTLMPNVKAVENYIRRLVQNIVSTV